MLRRPIKFHKGTSSEIASYTGEANSIAINTETNRIHVQNGTTAGGIPVALKSEVDQKQNTLVSGETIKSINGQSIVGSGNIVVTNALYLGSFPSLAALQAAHPTGTAGQSAKITYTGEPDKIAVWDEGDGDWVETGGTNVAISADADNQLQLGTDDGYYVPPVDISGKANTSDVGNKANLTTTDKTTLVNAVNELDSEIGNVSILPKYYFPAPSTVTSGIYTWNLLNTDLDEYYYGYSSGSTPENFIVKLNPTTGILTSYTIPSGGLLTSAIWELRATYTYTTLNTYLSDLENFVSKDLSSAVVDIYGGIKPHYTTSQNVTVANETEWLAELSKAVKATYASNNIKYIITLPTSINFQITLFNVVCPNLVIAIQNGTVVDCSNFTTNYYGILKSFILQIACVGVSIYGSASTTNGTGVAGIISGSCSNMFYANFSGVNLELSGFSSAPILNNLVGGNGVPKITGYSGTANFNYMGKYSEILCDGDASISGNGTITLTGNKNINLYSSDSVILKGSSYTGTATISGEGILEKQSTVSNYILDSTSRFTRLKINSNDWNELSYTDIQALTPTNGLSFYDTTRKINVRGDGTNWVDISNKLITDKIVTPFNYGAVGDGVTDDTTAVQAAINSGKNVDLFGGYFAVNNLTQSTAFQSIFSSNGIARLIKNANGPILTSSGLATSFENISFRGDSSTPTFTGDGLVTNGSDPTIKNCGVRWISGIPLLSTGTHTKIYGTCDIYQTTDTSGTGYDIVIGTSGTVTLYHQIHGVITTQATGGIKFIDTGSQSVIGGQIGKLTIDKSATLSGANGGMVCGVRIVGDIVVNQSNASFTGNQIASSSVTLGTSTSQIVFEKDNIYSNSTVFTDNGNNVIERYDTATGKIYYGADGVKYGIKYAGSSSYALHDGYIVTYTGYKQLANDGTTQLNLVSSSGTSNNVSLGHGTGTSFTNLLGGSGGIYSVVGGTSIIQTTSTGYKPTTDNTYYSGSLTNYWKGVYSQALYTKTGVYALGSDGATQIPLAYINGNNVQLGTTFASAYTVLQSGSGQVIYFNPSLSTAFVMGSTYLKANTTDTCTLGVSGNYFSSGYINSVYTKSGLYQLANDGTTQIKIAGISGANDNAAFGSTGASSSTNIFGGSAGVFTTVSGTSITQVTSAAHRPNTDNAINSGDATHRWLSVFAVAGTINTSDKRLKSEIKDIDDLVLDAWSKVNFKQYKMKEMKDGKIFFGVIAQEVVEVFKSFGLNALDYGLVEYSEWGAEDAILDDEGKEIKSKIKKGNRYGIRYEQALVLECALLRRKLEKLGV